MQEIEDIKFINIQQRPLTFNEANEYLDKMVKELEYNQDFFSNLLDIDQLIYTVNEIETIFRQRIAQLMKSKLCSTALSVIKKRYRNLKD